jgi:hypothetical protein
MPFDPLAMFNHMISLHSTPFVLVLLLVAGALDVSAQSPWVDFRPSPAGDPADSPIDLRYLNESVAGENGRIVARDGHFVHEKTGTPVRFWGVNGPPANLEPAQLPAVARTLSKYGVNLVRVHTPIFDRQGETDWEKVRSAHQIVAAMKAEGIYTHFSIYFPLWFKPDSDLQWLSGYDGQKPTFATLMINPEFQQRYLGWLKDLLIRPDPETGKSLADDPAVFGVELQNEDSFFFWTFDYRNIPATQMELLERQFAGWLSTKYGSPEDALTAWGTKPLANDRLEQNRVAFRPLWNLANERTKRDQDTVLFLLETQTRFYRETYDTLRSLGFQGLIHASNWATASPQRLGPLEKYSYMAGDFIDRHGYFDCQLEGENAAWSIRDQYSYRDRSALRFDPDEADGGKQFVHPVMDPHYVDAQGIEKPSMISETTFTRPNRYRGEAPWYYAAYGALQDSDAVIHFAFDGYRWEVKPQYWMQPWTLSTPAMMGQFPAAALAYRSGLIATGPVVTDLNLNIDSLLRLEGTPLPQDASFDELRLRDVPSDGRLSPDSRLDPLMHYVGRSRVQFSQEPTSLRLEDYRRWIDRDQQIVRSAGGELTLNYKLGLLTIDAPTIQGVSGNVGNGGAVQLSTLGIECDMDLIHIMAVSLDGAALNKSDKILLQLMTEERATGFSTTSAEDGRRKIESIGSDPWQFREIRGRIALRRPDAQSLQVIQLDHAGLPLGRIGDAERFELAPETLYYLIQR